MIFPTCRPKQPLRCWQFLKSAPGDTPVPRWLAAHLTAHDGDKWTFDYPDSSNEWTLDDGDWIIEFQGGVDPVFGCYTATQFAAGFDTVDAPPSGK